MFLRKPAPPVFRPPYSPFITTLSAEESAVGEAALQQLKAEFPGDGILEIFQMFEEEGGGMLEQISASLARGDGPRLRRAAHALRGAGANFGARSLEACCGQIEACGRRDDFATAATLLNEVRREFHRVVSALQLKSPTGQAS